MGAPGESKKWVHLVNQKLAARDVLDGARAPPVVTTNMQCRDQTVQRPTVRMRALVRSVLANDYPPDTVALDTDCPDTVGKMALMLLEEFLEGDVAQWDVTQVTPALWATLQAKMCAVGWRLVVASERAVAGVTGCESTTRPGHYLWQHEDVPGKEWPVFHLRPAGVFLAVAPNVGHQ